MSLFCSKSYPVVPYAGWTTCQCTRAKGSWKQFQDSLVVVMKKKKSTRKTTKASPVDITTLPLFDNELQNGAKAIKERESAKAMWEGALDINKIDQDYLTGLGEKFAIKVWPIFFNCRVTKFTKQPGIIIL